jgi:lipopolysaccharide/colanic/teichoic acid biosynthesis glycosyltransferase
VGARTLGSRTLEIQNSIVRPKLKSARRVLDDVSSLPALGGRRKRAFDIAMAGMALLVLMPIMLASAVLISLLSADSVILCERLIGRGGRTFVGYKFRIPAANAKSSSRWAERVAEALHASGLDQLPRLLNVMPWRSRELTRLCSAEWTH